MKQESFLYALGSAFVWKGLDRAAGLIKQIIIASVIGLSAQLDIFYMILAILGVLVFSWAGMIDVVAVPSMVKAWKAKRFYEFRQIASGLFVLAMAVSVLLVLILYLGKDLVAQVAIGFDLERRQLLADAMQWLLPAVFLFIPLRLMGSVLRAIRQFSSFYQSEFLVAFTVMICVAMFREDEHVLLWSFSLGVTVAFLFLLSKSRKLIFPLSNPLSHYVRQSLNLAPGLLILQVIHFSYVLTDRIFVSFLAIGAVSALAYAMSLVSMLPGVISLSGAFITVAAEQDTLEEREQRLNKLISLGIYMSFGATLLLLVASPWIIQVLLQRGMFSSADTRMVADCVVAYAWLLLPLFLIGPLDQIFQVERHIAYIVRRAAFGMVTNIVLNTIFLFGFGWGTIGIAFATSLSYWVMLIAGLYGLKKIAYQIEWLCHLKWVGWLISASVMAYFTCVMINDYFEFELIKLMVSAATIFGILLVAGLVYPGIEGSLVREKFLFCVPKTLIK